MLLYCSPHHRYINHNPPEKQAVMFIGLGVLAVASIAAITGTVISTARDGYHRQPTRSFD
ncbi:hypothetical protein GCM10022256_25840 [Frondihabitans peucedani]|uniref:Transmembrane protein n=1 Tax=Frondihabitans peucedani TaxID=598626 RepID=A0ABP8E495_9MICO